MRQVPVIFRFDTGKSSGKSKNSICGGSLGVTEYLALTSVKNKDGDSVSLSSMKKGLWIITN